MKLNIQRSITLAAMIGAFGLVSFASAPVASVSSSQSFALDGHAITAAGVTSWPVVVGDEITTSTAPAVMSFQDGSSVQLSPKSQAKITGTVESPKVLLTAGNLEYKLAPGSALSLANTAPDPGNGGAPVPAPSPAPPQATVNVASNHAFWIEGLLFAVSITALIVAVYDLRHLPLASYQ